MITVVTDHSCAKMTSPTYAYHSTNRHLLNSNIGTWAYIYSLGRWLFKFLEAINLYSDGFWWCQGVTYDVNGCLILPDTIWHHHTLLDNIWQPLISSDTPDTIWHPLQPLTPLDSIRHPLHHLTPLTPSDTQTLSDTPYTLWHPGTIWHPDTIWHPLQHLAPLTPSDTPYTIWHPLHHLKHLTPACMFNFICLNKNRIFTSVFGYQQFFIGLSEYKRADLTCDMTWHMTCDMWHRHMALFTQGVVNIVSKWQVPTRDSLALMMIYDILKIWRESITY